MNRLISLLGIALLLSLSACEDDDTNPSGGNGGGNSDSKSFTAQLNGDFYSASSQLFIQGSSTELVGIRNIAANGTRTDFSTSETIIITISTSDSDDLVVGTIFSSENLPTERYCSGTYALEEDGTSISAFTPENATLAATCTITAIDTVAQVWSGTFEFEAEADGGVSYFVTEGEFTNVSYAP